MPNADYQKIDLKGPLTKHNKYYFKAKRAIVIYIDHE